MLAKIESNADYYILRSIRRPGRPTDGQALEWLKRFGIDTYYPMVMEMKKVKRREMSRQQRASGIEIKKPEVVPLFPGYIFARLGQATVGWREIFRCAGLGGMLCDGDLPVLVREKLIRDIKARENNGIVPGGETMRNVYGLGEQVVVTEGPFATFTGVVEKGLDCPIEDVDPSTRIKVAVNLFGRAVPVELEVWQVAPGS